MYANGEAPLSELVHVANNIWLPAGTLARWNWVVAQAAEKYGATLRITGQNSSAWNTWNGYRPLSAQILYKNAYGNLAAQPRYSSHGLTYRGVQCAAFDVENWRDLAPGSESLAWARFVALMRLAGLTTDFVTPREQWHVGDFNDIWTIPAFAAPAGSGSHLNPPQHWKDADMRIIGTTDGKAWLVAAGNSVHIKNPDHKNLLIRVLNSDPSKHDTFTPEERVIIDSYMHALSDRRTMNGVTIINTNEGKGRAYLAGPGVAPVHILHGDDLRLLERYLQSGSGAVDTFTAREKDVIGGYLKKLAPAARAA